MRIELKQSQSLVMTPQLQQAIKLLQMSNQELHSFVTEELQTNPLLERVETGQNESLQKERDSSPAESFDPGNHSGGSYDPSRPDRPLSETVEDKPSLRDHLLSQIYVDFSDPAERMAAAALLEMLDETGYLTAETTLLRTQLGLSEEVFESLLARLQRLDPPGIFARSLRECLTVQLREKNRFDPAMAILVAHLDLVARHERNQLMRLCQVDSEDLADMLTELRALTPKPALSFVADVVQPVVPDVFLKPMPGGGWHVELNNDTLPRVLLNEEFHAQLQDGVLSSTDKAYLSERWQQANWLIKALRQRATTVLKVASEIVKQQDKFFIYGIQYLKPLVLKDIAEKIEMHESTVSRATQNKFMATPRGMFELKYFFSTALPTTGGTASVSSLTVQERIKELIAAEKPEEILSDDRLAAILKRVGIHVARRTVAKYREAMHISSSAQRRRVK
jgi:RNA polymerase sigma-54 factor